MKRADKEKAEAIAHLKELIKPGDTVYTILDHVSRSGMMRAIRVLVPHGIQKPGEIAVDFFHPNYSVGKALGLRHWSRNGHRQDALVMSGCGMDMGFALVYQLGSVLYGNRRCSQCGTFFPETYATDVTCGKCDGEIVGGYRCLGKGKCPSNYHVNAGHLDGGRAAERFDLLHTDGYALRHRWL